MKALTTIDPGSSSPGSAVAGYPHAPRRIVWWTWAERSASVSTIYRNGDAWSVPYVTRCDRVDVEYLVHGTIAKDDATGTLVVEGVYQPAGWARRKSAVGTIIPLSEHVGRLIQAFRPDRPVVLRPLADQWRAAVGIPPRMKAKAAGGMAIQIAQRNGMPRISASLDVQETIAESWCMFRAASAGALNEIGENE